MNPMLKGAVDYLTCMGSCNQARTIAAQIRFTLTTWWKNDLAGYRQDVQGGNHKYLAHQVAVLYNSLGQVGPSGTPIRKAIESEFGAIKEMVEKGQRLSDHMKNWLVIATFTCRWHGLLHPCALWMIPISSNSRCRLAFVRGYHWRSCLKGCRKQQL